MCYRKLLLCLGAVAFVSACTTASQSEVSRAGTPSFIVADRNQDGFIDRPEASNHFAINTIFDDIDSDGDGKVSRREYNE